MGYLVELNTHAGRLCFGPFDTLQAATKWARSAPGSIVLPLLGVEVSAGEVQAAASAGAVWALVDSGG